MSSISFFSQSPELAKLGKSLMDARKRVENIIPRQNDSQSPQSNPSIPSDPDSLSSSVTPVKNLANIQFEQLKEKNDSLQTQVTSFLAFVNLHCGQNLSSLDSCAQFVAQYFKPVNQLKQLQESYISVKMENESYQNQISDLKKELKQTKKKESKLKVLLKQLREYTNNLESQMASQQAEINELNLTISKQSPSQVKFPVKKISIDNQYPIHQIEEIIENQAKQIQILCEQRNKMITNYQILDQILNSNILKGFSKSNANQKIEKPIKPVYRSHRCIQTDPIFTNEDKNNYFEDILSSVFCALQDIAISMPNSNDKKPDILREVANINRYLDDHSIQLKKPDLHFLSIMNDEELKKSPLFDTFAAIVNILNIIINMERNEPKTKFIEDPELKQSNVELCRELSGLQNALCQLFECKTIDILKKAAEIVEKEKSQSIHLKRLEKQTRALSNEVKQLEMDVVDHKKQQQKDRKEFSRIATKMLDDITESINEQLEKNENQIVALNNKLESAKLMMQDLIEENKQQKLNNKKIIETKEKLMKQREIENMNFIQLKEIELKEKDELIQQLQEKIEELCEKYSKEKTLKKEFKNELNQLNNERENVFSTLTEKNQTLKSEIEELKTGNENKIQMIQNSMKNKLNDIEKVNERILRDYSKEKAMGQTLKMKLDEARRQVQLEKDHYNAKLSAMNLNLQNSYNELKEKYLSALIQIGENFDVPFQQNCEDQFMVDLLTKVEFFTQNKNILKDAMEARTMLVISSNETIVESIALLQNQLFEEKEKQSNEISQHQKEIKGLQKKIEMYQNASQKNNEWKIWSLSVLKQLKDSVDPSIPEVVIRKQIEEILWSSLHEKAAIRKTNLLRREKELLKNYSEFLEPVTKWNHKVKSARPLIIVSLFAKRLMKMSGTIPLSLAIRSRNLQ